MRCRRELSRWVLLVASAAVLASGCTGPAEQGPPSPDDTAHDFVAALQARHGQTLAGLLDPSTAAGLDAEALDRLIDRHVDRGSVSFMRVDVTGEIEVQTDEEGTPTSATVPYQIVFESRAVPEPFTLTGEFRLGYRPDDRAWGVEWDRSLLLPGFDEPRAGFEVRYRWAKRARILDRQGRVLARGKAAERTYPYGAIAGSIIGHIGRLTGAGIAEADSSHRAGDLVGASGLEAAQESRLAGEPGTRLNIVAGGKVLRSLGGLPPVRGKDVTATLDVEVQRAAEAAFGDTVGGAVVLDPHSGDVLAAVSSGSFNPNFYVGAESISPFNRAISGLYPPGSAMKVVTASAALDTGTVTPSTGVTGPKEYKGVRNFESGEFGTIDFATALQHSVNTAFAQVAEMLGSKKLARYAERFGFNLPPEMSLGAARSSFPFPEGLSDLMWSSIGQAQVLVTPLQMATVAATIANGGVRMEPRVVESDPKSSRRVMSAETAGTVAALMERVVNAGTGQRARIAGVRVAGKTGTAEVDVAGERRNHAWFVAFAPIGAPKVAVAVVSEYGGVGGQVAAPLARSILTAVLPLVP